MPDPATPPLNPSLTELIVKKFGMSITLTEEFLKERADQGRTGHSVPPTVEEVAEYEAWKAAFEPLHEQGIARSWWSDGGGDYAPEYEGPQGAWVWDEVQS